MIESEGAGKGYRGYITSRPVRGQEPPHQVQNMVVREIPSFAFTHIPKVDLLMYFGEFG